MSEENVEIVRKAVEVVSDHKIPEDLIAPDIRMWNARTAVTNKLYVGAAGLRQWQEDFLGVMDEEARFEVQQVVAAEGEVVVVRVHIVGHGLASGAPLDLGWLLVCWLRDGRITRVGGYLRRREALEAAGLSE